MHYLFPVKGYTMNIKWYLPIAEKCLKWFSRDLWIIECIRFKIDLPSIVEHRYRT